uniref:Uncharacterized protein n=1 Tax=Cyprinodon variegatus TaxID=28743 RepID=A0A3Q2FHY9_CYPVA
MEETHPRPLILNSPPFACFLWKHYWGVSCGGINICSESSPSGRSGEQRGLSVVLSSSEKQPVKEALTSVCGPENIMYASGAGYKILCVIQGLADAYILSEGSTYKWDSCAPHALLRALGGGVVDLAVSLQQSESGVQDPSTELTYHLPRADQTGADRWANYGGLVAYRDCSHLTVMFLNCGRKPGHPERTHTCSGRPCKL